jgi:hypothetical protein
MRHLPASGIAFLIGIAAIAISGCGRSTAASVSQATATSSSAASSPAPQAAAAADVPATAPQEAETTASPNDQPTAEAATEPTSIASDEPASAPAAPPKPLPPPADRTPTRPGDAEKLTFDDLNLGMQADIVFRPFMLTDRVNELAGRRVSIIGYMHGGVESQRGIKEFILLKNTQCKFGPGGQADHLASVTLKDGQTTSLTTSPLKVEGTFRIEPFQGPDGNTWSIYRLEDAQIR